MQGNGTLRAFAIAAACAGAILVLPAAASAATNVYAPNAESRNFNGGPGGWTADVTYSGVCVAGVSCLSVTNSHEENGGPNGVGDGYLRSNATSLAALLSTTRIIWESPAFNYNGAGGRVPQSLTLGLDRRSDLASLLPVIADDAVYSVDAVPVGGGDAVALIEPTSLEGAEDVWVSEPPTAVAPAALELGQPYRLRITSVFSEAVAVLATGSVAYDNVVLRAERPVSPGELGKGVKATIGAAALKGRTLRARAGCPAVARPAKCTLKVVALLKRKGKKVTKAKRVGVRAGAKKVVKLKVKRNRLAQLAKRRKIWIRVNARAAGTKAVARKRVKLRVR